MSCKRPCALPMVVWLIVGIWLLGVPGGCAHTDRVFFPAADEHSAPPPKQVRAPPPTTDVNRAPPRPSAADSPRVPTDSETCADVLDTQAPGVTVTEAGAEPRRVWRLQPTVGASARVTLSLDEGTGAGYEALAQVTVTSATVIHIEGSASDGSFGGDLGLQDVGGMSVIRWTHRGTKGSKPLQALGAILGLGETSLIIGAGPGFFPEQPIGIGARWRNAVLSEFGASIAAFDLVAVEAEAARVKMRRITCLESVPQSAIGSPFGAPPPECRADRSADHCFDGAEWAHTTASGELTLRRSGVTLPAGTVTVREQVRINRYGERTDTAREVVGRVSWR